MNCAVLLVSKLYKCSNGHSEIPANDPSSYLPFLLMHKSGLTTELLQFIEDLIDSGLSVNAIESLIRESYKRHLSLQEERFWIDRRVAMSLNTIPQAIDTESTFPKVTHFPSSNFITKVILYQIFETMRRIIISTFRL